MAGRGDYGELCTRTIVLKQAAACAENKTDS